MAIYQFNDDVITIQLFLYFSKQKTAASWSGIDVFSQIESRKKSVLFQKYSDRGQTIEYISIFSGSLYKTM